MIPCTLSIDAWRRERAMGRGDPLEMRGSYYVFFFLSRRRKKGRRSADLKVGNKYKKTSNENPNEPMDKLDTNTKSLRQAVQRK